MKKCISCGNEQEAGKFCGKCGAPFDEAVEAASVESSNLEATATIEQANVAPAQPNEHVEKVKDQSKKFWNYFLKYIKNPSEIFATGEKEFAHALTSMILFAFILGITVYVSISSFTRTTMSGFGDFGELFMEQYSGPPFFTVFGSIFIFTLLSMALVVLAILITGKLFGPGSSWKKIVSYYGTHLLASSVLAIIGFLLILVKSYVFGNIVLVLSFSLALSIIPLFIVTKLLHTASKNVDKFYGYLLYIVLFAIIYGIFITIIADSSIGQVVNRFSEF